MKEIIFRSLMRYQCEYTVVNDYRIELSLVLTPDGGEEETGVKEIGLLTQHIANSILTYQEMI